MKKVSLGKLVGGLLAGKESASPWRPEDLYPRLLGLDVSNLKGRQGIYAVWHLGVRPQWLRVGGGADLAATLTGLAAVPWIAQHQNNAGVFVAWAFVTPVQLPGMVRFLAEKLSPAFQNEFYEGDLVVDPAVAPVTIMLPPETAS